MYPKNLRFFNLLATVDAFTFFIFSFSTEECPYTKIRFSRISLIVYAVNASNTSNYDRMKNILWNSRFHPLWLSFRARANITFDILQDNIQTIPGRIRAHENNFDRRSLHLPDYCERTRPSCELARGLYRVAFSLKKDSIRQAGNEVESPPGWLESAHPTSMVAPEERAVR